MEKSPQKYDDNYQPDYESNWGGNEAYTEVDVDKGTNVESENIQYEKKDSKNQIIISILIFGALATVAFIIGILKNTAEDFEKKYSQYNEINYAFKDFTKYSYVDLERTATTSYPILIEDFPETKNFAKYCLPCTSIFSNLENVFDLEMTKRKIENIKHIPLSETDLYLNIASKTNDLIDNYQEPYYPSAFDIIKKPSVTDYKLSLRVLKSWLWASLYYASQDKTSEALLLAFAPILVCQDIETNSADGADMDTKIAEVKIDACKQLLYLINFYKLDKSLIKKIAITFIKIVNSEPSFVRQIENHMRCDKKYFSYLEKENNAFVKYILNSKMHKEWYDRIFNEAREQIRELEKSGDFSNFNSWQKNLYSQLLGANQKQDKKAKGKTQIINSYIIFKEQELTLTRKALNHQVPYFGYYYFIYLEKIAIMKGTAVALAFKAYMAEKSIKPFAESELNTWLGIYIPKDPLSRRAYRFHPSFNSKYLLEGSTIKNAYYSPVYIENNLPLLVEGGIR